MAAITIENGSVKIPIEAVEGEALVVLTLASDAYLILRAAELLNMSQVQLLKLVEITRTIALSADESPYYHPTKIRALKELRAKGISVSGGEEYGLAPASITLEKVQAELASISSSLSDDIIAEREER